MNTLHSFSRLGLWVWEIPYCFFRGPCSPFTHNFWHKICFTMQEISLVHCSSFNIYCVNILS